MTEQITSFETLKTILQEDTPRLAFRGATDGFIQLCTLLRLTRSRVILIAPDTRSLVEWGDFAASAFSEQTEKSFAILPYFSIWGRDRYVNQSLARRQRLFSLGQFNLGPNLIVTTLAGLAQKTLPKSEWLKKIKTVSVGDSLDQDDLLLELENLGYFETTTVEEEGQYTARGSIVDIFAVNSNCGLRIEFEGEQIMSLRTFDPSDQKSRKSLDTFWIAPASEAPISKTERKGAAQRVYEKILQSAKTSSYDRDGIVDSLLKGYRPQQFEHLAPIIRNSSAPTFSYLDDSDLIIFTSNIDQAVANFSKEFNAFQNDYQEDIESGAFVADPAVTYASPEELVIWLKSHSAQIEFGNLGDRVGFKIANAPRAFSETIQASQSGLARFDLWMDSIRDLANIDLGRAIIAISQKDHYERLDHIFRERGIVPSSSSNALNKLYRDGKLPPVGITMSEGYFSDPIWFEVEQLLLFPDQILFSNVKRRVQRASAKLKNLISSFRDLKVGDLVVHIMHGIGRYRGMLSLSVGGIKGDFLHLEYAGNDKIYLPVDKLSQLQRYTSDSSAQAPLDRLGTGQWDKRKQKVKTAVKDMADKLLQLYAKRSLASPRSYALDDEAYMKLEAEFPYQETEDQHQAINDVSSDLQGGKPMDRLVCGDVGFGKTEVAVRAAFRVAASGYQVLVLVPTTILCYQHYRTFKDRLSKHGLSVGQLNRFVDKATTAKVLSDLKDGRIDIVIGTHRLLSQDVSIKRIGLVIVDEEQKFGVSHKERLKEMRASADFLTLTATPIPRTLHMSMLGLKDISLITTPPKDRMPVKTVVSNFDESLVRQAIEFELRRGGQIFFVHNNVKDLDEICLHLKSLVPGLSVQIAHGQMNDDQLEKVILDFIDQKFSMLLCTTIIEAGIDMPNVNTLIVNQADRFGLSQLYQLRGRVGRSTQQAFAYFIVKNLGQISDEARERLEVMVTYQDLGSGFHIASHDLEIRGAGNLLGAEQSGRAGEVGLELYTQLLEEAIAELRGSKSVEDVDPEIKLPINAFIPPEYVPSEKDRLLFYKQLFSAATSEEVFDIETVMRDRYGVMNEYASRLIKIAKIKQSLKFIQATSITANPKARYFEIKFQSIPEKFIESLIQRALKEPQTLRLSPDFRLFIYSDLCAPQSAQEEDKLLEQVIYWLHNLTNEVLRS